MHWNTCQEVTQPIISTDVNSSTNIVNVIDCISKINSFNNKFYLQSLWNYPNKDAAFCIEGYTGTNDLDSVISKIKSAARDHDGTILCHRTHVKNGDRGK